MSKETMREKVAAAASKKQASTGVVSTIQFGSKVKILNPMGSLKSYWGITDETNFKKEVLSLSTTLEEKVKLLLASKPLIVDYNADGQDDLATDLTTSLTLQEVYFKSIGVAFNNGVAHVLLQKYGDKVVASIADPQFPNVVYKIAGIKYRAEIWTALQTGRARYWKKTIITPETIYNEVYGGDTFDSKKKTSVRKVNKELKDNSKLMIKPKRPNEYGFVNVEDIPYLPSFNETPQHYKEIAPAKRLVNKQKFLNEGTEALSQELQINRTKLYVDKDMIDEQDEASLRLLAKQGIVAALTDSGNSDGSGKAIEIIMGDPKVASYWEHITNVISLAIQELKLSELTSEESTTATDAIFSKGNDVELANGISTFHTLRLARLLEKARLMLGKEKVAEEDIDTSDWNVQIVPNVIMNEAKMTDIVIKQLGAGLINMATAKVKLENISKAAAIAALEEEEEIHNPTLDAVSGFGDSEEEPEKGGDTKTNKPASGENTPKPE